MNWRFCVDTREQRALDRCSGSMNASTSDGAGDGDGYGDGAGDGYGAGDGNSSREWR